MKKIMNLLKKDQRGLTLVELLAVIVILAIIGSIAFVSIGKVTENSRKDAHVANAVQLIEAVKLYEASNGEPLTSVNSVQLIEAGFLSGFVNPWGSNAETGDYVGTVRKGDDGIYYVTITSSNAKPEINDLAENLVKQGRKAIEGANNQPGNGGDQGDTEGQ